jgi:hypothetical protein
MSGENALDDEMRHTRPPSGFGPDPLALDEGTAERLLAGRLHPADAPPEYWGAAMVLAAAAAPPTPDELAGERQAVAAFTSVAPSIPHRAAPRRQPVLTRFVSFKLAAAAAIAALSVAGVAGAATGTLPDPAQRVAHRMLGGAGVPGPDDHAAQTADDKGSTKSTKSDHSPTGPDATGHAKAGLCRAWAAGQGGENGKKLDATAFKALADAAGGADGIADYCADATSGSEAHGQQGATPTPSSTVPAARGQGADNGQGQGNGGGQGSGQGQGQGSGGAPAVTRPDPGH